MHLIYVLPLLISAIIVSLLGIYAWRYRSRTAALPFTLLMLAVLIWVVMTILELISPDLQTRLFLANISFIGIAPTHVIVLALILDYTGKLRRFKWLVFVSLIIPVLSNILLWTNDFHHLWRGVSTLDSTTAPFLITVYNYGPWFYWIHAPAAYLTYLVCIILLIRSLISTAPIYRRQIAILLAGLSLPLLTDFFYILGLSPIANLNLTPVAFSFAGLIISEGLFRHRFLNLMPIARDAIIESMTDIVIVLDDQNYIVDLNPAAQGILNQSYLEQTGKHIRDVLPEYVDLFDQAPGAEEIQEEVTLGEGSDHAFYKLRLSPLYRGNKRMVGRIITIHDITERKLADQERERLIADLDAYAHTVAHDLKNPLSIQVGYSELLLTEWLTDENKRESIEALKTMSFKMMSIIDELLLLSSVRKQQNIEVSPVDMALIVEDIQRRLAKDLEDAGATFTMPATWPLAQGYTPWLEEVWFNYLSNAIKYGGTPPRIELGATVQPDGMIRYWVRDNGDGLSAEEQAQLFVEFSQLEPYRAEGHGLGLSIVKRIVERLDGAVGVESEKGKGSVFYFTLPNAAPEA